MNATYRLKLSAAAAVIAAVSGAYAIGNVEGIGIGSAQAAQPLAPAAAPAPIPAAAPPDMSGIVARNGQAVVNISVSGTRKLGAGQADLPPLDPDDPFYPFFRHFQGPQPRGEMPVHGLGSGFIVSPEGIVLTNAHVVDGADEVTVKLTDKREYQAKVLGLDKASDVAVLKIDGQNLPVVKTDVAVNPGNSGGPLFNMAGEVQRGRLGISIQEVNQSLADSFGLKRPAGALVGSVEKGSPAAKAGLEPGDVILGIDGKDIVSSAELPAIVATMVPGETARLQVWRHGGTRDIDVKVGKFGDDKVAANDQPDAAKGRLGVAVLVERDEARIFIPVDLG